ncbi:MAG: hypothetical protein QF842_01395 [Candidatus Marinimicrobia bacterium]|mgnify:CR=1 FL=1|jgi:hypothetical protein|nr:hypothetical protein [Candidatus Neomarinimicrobiota bacterium]MDP6611986.1 hypothetical protein [Candidatus Neomarinimicrobiota bacterium]|tara:strand:+ start:12547 stop:15477 length:2931 start_codon:yes stop_codon:yes gene_type:complete
MKLRFILLVSLALGQVSYNHPELDWKTIETDHFRIHFYGETEQSALEGAYVAERIYPFVTNLYLYEPFDKTDIVFTDVDDISNGAAYFYDNKIVIWTSPLDFELRGSHRWLQNVITHEFTHIVSIQRAQKFGKSVPGGYLQWIGYEKEKRPDVLYGYPNTLVSYPIPGTVVPPWLAEGAAQFMYPGADWDNWDSVRDMILRDRVLNNNMLSWREMNTFGKSGIGNESVYNAGFALARYLAVKYGPESLEKIMASLSKPMNYSINRAFKDATGREGKLVYDEFETVLKTRYETLTESVIENELKGRIIHERGTVNFFPIWNEDGTKIAYISNQDHDYFGSTDLFIYHLESKISEKIIDGVYSKPTWNGKKIYYAKKGKMPNKVGSKFYDLYEYDLSTQKEFRLTKDARSFFPVYSATDSALFYLATHDGTQNIFKIDLQTKSTEKLTDFNNREIIGGLNYDEENDRLIFDMTTHHFRNIHYLSLEDSISGTVLNNELWDERQSDHVKNGMVYSDDRSGIFNLYFIGKDKQGYLTNVSGGAFMADIHENGKVVYALFTNGQYKLAILDSIQIADDANVGYTPLYFQRNKNLSPAITETVRANPKKYKDHFPPMFTMPRMAMDYGTFKPGIYFYSSEILDKVTVTGGASVNRSKDLDLFFLFEYKHLFPTLFFETFYLTRNTEESTAYSVYKLDNNLKFRLIEFQGGLRIPFYGTQFELYGSWSQYRASIKEQVVGKPQLRSGFGYDYFKGTEAGINWNLRQFKRRIDQDINPVGYEVDVQVGKEWNQFIDGLDLSESGTLISKFNKHNFVQSDIRGKYLWEIPKTNRWTVSIGGQAGWISNASADSFFHFFAGGMPGLKGYPFYSLEGTNMVIGELGLRIPIFREKHIPMGWFTLQHSTIGLVGQMGDAWNRDQSKFSAKSSAGIEFRLAGYSFYNYPTSIGLELHRGLATFKMDIGDGKTLKYGGENRFYFTVLFGF